MAGVAVGPKNDERACAGCPFNAAWPGEASIGCRVSLPGDVWRDACAELGEKAPTLLADVHALRGGGLDDAVDVDAARRVVDAWIALPGVSSSGVECASVGHAFVAAAKKCGEGVRLWE